MANTVSNAELSQEDAHLVVLASIVEPVVISRGTRGNAVSTVKNLPERTGTAFWNASERRSHR